jgi:hypothetical protein
MSSARIVFAQKKKRLDFCYFIGLSSAAKVVFLIVQLLFAE